MQEAERTETLEAINRRLEEEIRERKEAEIAEREQRVLAEALRDTTAALNSTLDLDEVLERILANVGRVVPHEMANIMLVEDDMACCVRARGYKQYGLHDIVVDHQWYLPDTHNLNQMQQTKQPLAIPDTGQYEGWIRIPELHSLSSYAGAPIVWNDQILGFINLQSPQPGYFTQKHANRLGIFADHAAIALRNARLYEQAQELAAVQERQWLAQNLHDAISQTLWSATLIAEVLPTLWQTNPEKGKDRLRRLAELTRGALAEMRTLLLELRPDTLLETTLSDLLEQLIAATRTHTKAQIEATVVENCRPPDEVQIAVYRIAREAFTNILRHTTAASIEVALTCSDDWLRLLVRDDGSGFTPEAVAPGRFGLDIMRERSDTIGATLTINSQPGTGTTIILEWSSGDTEENP